MFPEAFWMIVLPEGMDRLKDGVRGSSVTRPEDSDLGSPAQRCNYAAMADLSGCTPVLEQRGMSGGPSQHMEPLFPCRGGKHTFWAPPPHHTLLPPLPPPSPDPSPVMISVCTSVT